MVDGDGGLNREGDFEKEFLYDFYSQASGPASKQELLRMNGWVKCMCVAGWRWGIKHREGGLGKNSCMISVSKH